MARHAGRPKPGPTNNDNPALRVKEMLEAKHDQAARDVFAETQKAMGKRTIILEPHALEQCITNISQGNQGKLLESMNKAQDLLILGIWEYIWQWADRILKRIPQDVAEVYRILQFRGVETYIILI